MKVCELLSKKEKTLSFEFFPPKTLEQENTLYKTIGELKQFDPDFVSVTYGALGSNSDKAFFWAEKIKKDFLIEPVAHLTCIAASKDEIKKKLIELKTMNVSNILALRGDIPSDCHDFKPPKDGFSFASDLVDFIRREDPGFCVGVAGYPEGHCDNPSLDVDILNLKKKIDAGSEYIITQLFFDNSAFYSFYERSRNKNISVPIIPGIMPITSTKQIKRMTGLCGARIPKDLAEKIEKYSNDQKAIEDIGIEQAIKQIDDLSKNGIFAFHFFVMNRSDHISKILKSTICRR